jgi:hypothetical protein
MGSPSILEMIREELPLDPGSFSLPPPSDAVVGLVIVDEVKGFCIVGGGNLVLLSLSPVCFPSARWVSLAMAMVMVMLSRPDVDDDADVVLMWVWMMSLWISASVTTDDLVVGVDNDVMSASSVMRMMIAVLVLICWKVG